VSILATISPSDHSLCVTPAAIAEVMGAEAAMAADSHLAAGLNVARGTITNAAVAQALGLPLG
jgi:alanine dehydrogenase